VRAATPARLALGTACLIAPGPVLAVVGGDAGRRTLLLARVLGARLTLQAGADLALGRRTRSIDVILDLAHAASMVPLVVGSPVHRRSAGVSAALSTATAVLDLASHPARD
jgi:hypothetical protein